MPSIKTFMHMPVYTHTHTDTYYWSATHYISDGAQQKILDTYEDLTWFLKKYSKHDKLKTL